jgi:nucleoside-diphosphate-sugar epimerase
MLQTGVLGTANLLEAVSTIPLERLVHLGSSLEYGPRDRPLLESDRLEPRTFRGAAKAAATLLCQQFARSDHCSVVVLRAFSVYGPWEAGTRLVPTAILAALRHHDMNLTGPGHRRDLVFVQDVVEACLLAVQAEPIAGEIINVGSGRQWANEEIVAQVQAISGQRIRVQAGNYPPSPSDTGYCVADIEKAKRLLGWKPRHTLQSGLEETVTWFRRHLDLYPSRREQAGD